MQNEDHFESQEEESQPSPSDSTQEETHEVQDEGQQQQLSIAYDGEASVDVVSKNVELNTEKSL